MRLHEHLLLLPGLFARHGDLGFFQRRRLRKLQFLRDRRRGRKQAAADQKAEEGSNLCDAAAVRPGRRRTSVSQPRHHPSSWYNNAINPVRLPTSTGNQAAATGCISSALLRSSVTLDKT